MAKPKKLSFKVGVNAPPAEAYRAFTSATSLREWFCDVASVDARTGGPVYVAWRDGYYAAGEYTKLTPSRTVAFTWLGRGEPAATGVPVRFTPKKNGTSVLVTHTGATSGKKWAATVAAFERGWTVGLENLKSILETGQDLRLINRPILGVTGIEDLTPSAAKRLGTPVQAGVRLDGAAPGMGAAAAGLQQDDVIVSVAGQKTPRFSVLVGVMGQHRAGDEVPVVFYRGAEERRTTLTFTKRPVAEVPGSAAELAEAARAMFAQSDAELAAALAGLTDAEAAQRPSPQAWSVNEVLAHLLHGERDWHAWVAELILGEERPLVGFAGNSHDRTQATAAAYGSPAALFSELQHNERETVEMLAALPEGFAARRGSYWRAGLSALGSGDHVREHLDQIRAAAAAARQAAGG